MKSKRFLYLISMILATLIILTFTVFNPPQCPSNYTQAQVDAANCIVGANIGVGLLVLFVILPLSLAVLALWFIALSKKKKK